MTAKHAAFTMVSKNYFAVGRVLAETYLAHHPGHEFIIALVDKADGMVPATLECGAEVAEMADFAMPDIGRFIYRYSIMELNTAVKPFIMADLFARGYETLVFLDPDILVCRPLDSVYAALEEASIVLIPHIRKPYFDAASPSDLTILQAGTYNLGFMALRAGESATKLIEWWMTKLYRDCVVDIPNGLFVDQKWVDLVPALFPDHRILHDPTINVAYWNLHDRTLAQEGEGWTVDGEPLCFFHFSGYNPFAPAALSKHQDRHVPAHAPALRALTDHYAALLFAAGHEHTSRLPYAFDTLSNGVRVPIEIVRLAMQWASRAGWPTPCPVTEPDAFCRFLMARDVLPDRPDVVLLFHFLLRLRPDVAAAFPAAERDSDDEGFRGWIRTTGAREFRLDDLLPFEDRTAVADYVADLFARIRKAGRDDILERHRAMWSDAGAFAAFADWVANQGARQLRVGARHAEALRRAAPGISRVLNIYFLRGDLQVSYPQLGDPGQAAAFAGWLRHNAHTLDLAREEASLFAEYALANPGELEMMRFHYQHEGRPPRVPASLYEIDARRREIASLLTHGEVQERLLRERSIEPADHFLARPGGAPAGDELERLSVPGLDARRNFDFVARIREGLAARAAAGPRVNLAGFLQAASGMGESARSLRATLASHAGQVREVTLPHPLAGSGGLPAGALHFGWPLSGADVTVSVANADSAPLLGCFLPPSYWGRRNVGYWVWETETLPLRFRESAGRFDEIWTPSRHSAEAIRRTVDCPVRVLPHTVDFDAIARARADRRRYGLPEKGVLFGFSFDPLSVIERKNVRGLVRAFKEAFRDDDGCWLALRVNGRTQGLYDYEMLRATARSPRVLFLEATLSRDDALGFMKSLDAWVSLHRAEGFGLTCAEAMAMGLPVVATGYSGNLEFMDEDNSLLVPARVVETERPWGPYPRGSRWGEPDLEAAVAHLRSLRDEARRHEIGARALASVRERLDTRRLGKLAWSMLEALAAGGGEAT